jgi:hypothetical protein
MKLTLLVCLFFSFRLAAQLEYLVEYNISNVLSTTNKIIDNTFLVGIKKNKNILSIGVGREDWYLEYFDNVSFTNPSIYNAHCSTYKVSGLLEHQFFLFKTKLSLNLGIGGKMFFLNQMKDSLSVFTLDSQSTSLSIYKPSNILLAKMKNMDKINGSDLDEFAFIKSVPFAITPNLSFQYSFNKWMLKFYAQPSIMKVKYTIATTLKEGSFYTTNLRVGLGVSFLLNRKIKKKQDEK